MRSSSSASGGRFATDLSTASRTQLLAVGGRDWDEQLLDAFGSGASGCPRSARRSATLGELRHKHWPVALPLTAQLVDQQAALAGSGAVRAGELKATYGTGVFVLARTAEPVRGARAAADRRLGRAGGGGGVGEVSYALDGGVFAAGSLLDWLAEGLGLAPDAPALAALAASVPDSAGVLVLPALAGLGAPWWRPDARGVIAGLHPRYALRTSRAPRSRRSRGASRTSSRRWPRSRLSTSLRVDGGLTNDATLLQIQADALGLPI